MGFYMTTMASATINESQRLVGALFYLYNNDADKLAVEFMHVFATSRVRQISSDFLNVLKRQSSLFSKLR